MTRVLWPEPAAVAEAAVVLRDGGLVAFPTETVYGLGADACDPDAVERIFAVKGRPADNPLIVHVADASDLERVAAAVTPLARALAARWWPGPLTLVVDAAATVPAVTTGGLDSVAVRVPDHPVARALLAAADIPVAAPSANRSGRPSPTTAAHVLADLGGLVDIVLDAGPTDVGLESTVVDARGDRPVVLRDGAITREDLHAVDMAAVPAERSPGTRYRHYAPACRVEIAAPGGAGRRAATLAAHGQRVGVIAPQAVPPPAVTLACYDDAADLARQLYAALRAAEDARVDVVVVEAVPDTGVGRAVMDRVRRAAG